MAKARVAYVCNDCGAEHSKWQGQCSACEAWNTLTRITLGPAKASKPAAGYAGTSPTVQILADVDSADGARIATGFAEFDRVLGGGLVPGSVVLIGGEPGAGKSTLLLQITTSLATLGEVLYVSGEESLQQLAMRARRLELPLDRLRVASETRAEEIAALIEQHRPLVVVL